LIKVKVKVRRCREDTEVLYLHGIFLPLPLPLLIINLLAQKHDKVTCATKQIERDSKDTDATNSCPRKVQIKLVRNTLQQEVKVI